MMTYYRCDGEHLHCCGIYENSNDAGQCCSLADGECLKSFPNDPDCSYDGGECSCLRYRGGQCICSGNAH
jgi:hypothetical protein